MYETSGGEGEAIVLFLEDLGPAGDPWTLTDFAAAADAIGRFNASFVGRGLPDAEWLLTNWSDRQSEPVDLDAELALIHAATARSTVTDALRSDVAQRAERMVRHQPAFKTALDDLPPTLCHHDAARGNLFVRRTDGEAEVVAIDWELIGTGPIGADIAPLISGSLRKGDYPAEAAAELDATVLAAYSEGLRAGGWTGPDASVRLGLSASLALRYWYIRDTLRNLSEVSGPEPRPEILISLYLLDRSDEALSMIGVR